MCTSFHWISGVDRRTRRVVAVDVGRIDVDRFDKPVGAMNIGDSIAGPGWPRLGCHTCPGDNLGLGSLRTSEREVVRGRHAHPVARCGRRGCGLRRRGSGAGWRRGVGRRRRRGLQGGGDVGAGALEQDSAGADDDRVAAVAVLVSPLLVIELAFGEHARPLGEILSTGGGLPAVHVDGEVRGLVGPFLAAGWRSQTARFPSREGRGFLIPARAREAIPAGVGSRLAFRVAGSAGRR